MLPLAPSGPTRSIHRKLWMATAIAAFAWLIGLSMPGMAQEASTASTTASETVDAATQNSGEIAIVKPEPKTGASNRLEVLIASLTIFVLAVFVGFEVINKVPPTLHTPLMSGSNAISGITVIGALLATGFGKLGFGSILGVAAVILAMINVAGGFWVTHRMLAMFKKK